MKTVLITSRSRILNDLLAMAQRADLVLRLADGTEFILTRKSKARSFQVGDSDDFSEEVTAARKNKRLMKFLDERGKKAKQKRGASIEQVRQELGL